MHSIAVIDSWPVDHAAVAVRTAAGPAGTAGPVDRVFDLASVTKLLSAYAALVAVEEGAIELDQPAGPPGATVRHLLAHTSGLAFDEQRVRSEPGRRRIYSSAGFEVLAAHIEQETAIAFPAYVAEAVFAPLGMTASALPGPAGHGGRSTVGDLDRFAGELLAPTLISRSLWAEATTVQYPGLDGILPGYGMQRPNDWGLGFELRRHKSPHWTGSRNAPATFGHFGQSGTFLWVDPVAGVACVALTDRPFGDWAKPLWPALSDAALAEFTSS
ncbi:beta-lactamase family protein [Rhodococcus sp. D2-41]|uniref:serine hydrolase domain-containing protein n=1 Tax=Speluncibacter jeojiensis TaxID=2710754 RepID=UPI00240ECF20|nr:serine hydrolase domain-containing protein [Rhodococcus sp. D2-41]MDG3011878.1 beta-lactamase family protein [Rhodococcus sp. D2-41]